MKLRVECKLDTPPSVFVDIKVDDANDMEDFERKVQRALERVDQGELCMDCYIAELALTEGYTVASMEEWDDDSDVEDDDDLSESTQKEDARNTEAFGSDYTGHVTEPS